MGHLRCAFQHEDIGLVQFRGETVAIVHPRIAQDMIDVRMCEHKTNG